MAEIVAQQIIDTGLAANYGAAAATFEVAPDDVVLHIKNGNAAATTLTVTTPGTVDSSLAVADLTVVVGAGTEMFVGPFPNRAFEDSSDNLVHCALSVTATVTVAAIRL